MMNIFYLKRRFFLKRTEKGRRRILRDSSCKVSDRARFYCDLYFVGKEPYLFEIGENCLFASGCHLMTHDSGVKVLNSLGCFDKRDEKMGGIKIGNNVYVGMISIILGNVLIGDNSVVTSNVPSNCVVVGSPARVIFRIDEYYKKNSERGVFYEIKPNKKQYLMDNVKLLEY